MTTRARLRIAIKSSEARAKFLRDEERRVYDKLSARLRRLKKQIRADVKKHLTPTNVDLDELHQIRVWLNEQLPQKIELLKERKRAGVDSRSALLAYAFVRGKQRCSVEVASRDPPRLQDVQAYVASCGWPEPTRNELLDWYGKYGKDESETPYSPIGRVYCNNLPVLYKKKSILDRLCDWWRCRAA